MMLFGLVFFDSSSIFVVEAMDMDSWSIAAATTIATLAISKKRGQWMDIGGEGDGEIWKKMPCFLGKAKNGAHPFLVVMVKHLFCCCFFSFFRNLSQVFCFISESGRGGQLHHLRWGGWTMRMGEIESKAFFNFGILLLFFVGSKGLIFNQLLCEFFCMISFFRIFFQVLWLILPFFNHKFFQSFWAYPLEASHSFKSQRMFSNFPFFRPLPFFIFSKKQ